MSTSGHPGVRAAALGLCVVALLALATLQGGGPPAKPSLLLRSPPQRRLQHAGRWFRATVGPCRHAFIDLGTNIGDVMADLMNNAYPQAESKHMRWNHLQQMDSSAAKRLKVSPADTTPWPASSSWQRGCGPRSWSG
eukprot:scaffold301_cov243-Pinguiococcus_pyrenoidosus.AAC.149